MRAFFFGRPAPAAAASLMKLRLR